jgi:hypothetical protein
MGMTFDVYVINEDEQPQAGRRVDAYLPSGPLGGLLAGPVGGKLTEYTDDDGHAAFETADDGYSEVTIYVSGDKKGTYDLTDGAGFTVAV